MRTASSNRGRPRDSATRRRPALRFWLGRAGRASCGGRSRCDADAGGRLLNALLWLLVAVVVLVSAALWANWTASRLDRLHHLVETARAALDAQLVRRSAVAIEVASSGVLDPASSVLLAGAAHEARAAADDDRELAESALSAALRAVLGDPELRAGVSRDGAGRELLDEMDTACRRVLLARTFHNDAVTAALRVRRKRLVRWLRLAGNAAMPEFFEIDDAPPPTGPAAVTLS